MSKQEHTPFQFLQFRIAEAYWRWKVWKQLFLGDPSKPDELMQRHASMNSWAPSFFAMLQNLLLDDVILRICKLDDPEYLNPRHANKRRNLSLEAAKAEALDRLEDASRRNVTKLIREFHKAARPLTTWRNRRISHEDHRTSVGQDVLPSIQLARIEACLSSATRVMRVLDTSESEYGYEHLIAMGDGESVLYALRCADQYQKECALQFRPPIS